MFSSKRWTWRTDERQRRFTQLPTQRSRSPRNSTGRSASYLLSARSTVRLQLRVFRFPVNDSSGDHGQYGMDVADLEDGRGEVVAAQDGKVGEFSDGERPALVVIMRK